MGCPLIGDRKALQKSQILTFLHPHIGTFTRGKIWRMESVLLCTFLKLLENNAKGEDKNVKKEKTL